MPAEQQVTPNRAEFKKYSQQAKTGIRGEAYFEMLLSQFAIPHHVTGPKDLGIDYFCEWANGDRPSGVLFAVQIKTFRTTSATISAICSNNRFNNLCEFKITNSALNIEDKTANYWKGLGIPVYLFAIEVSEDMSAMNCYYKRYTPKLTSEKSQQGFVYSTDFFRCNNGTSFLAFATVSENGGHGGFARDLFIDHVRCAYAKGSVAFPNPQDIGLARWSADSYFSDLYQEYKSQLKSTFNKFKRFMDKMSSSASD
jgi:hypothetical protein